MSRAGEVSWANGTGLLARVQRDVVLSTLKKVKGNRRAAALILGIGERTLYRMLGRFPKLRERPKLVKCGICKGRKVCPECFGRGLVEQQ